VGNHTDATHLTVGGRLVVRDSTTTR